jgi:hypothetical protein
MAQETITTITRKLEAASRLADFSSVLHQQMGTLSTLLRGGDYHGVNNRIYDAAHVVYNININASIRQQHRKIILGELQTVVATLSAKSQKQKLLSPSLLANLPTEKLKILGAELNECWGRNSNATAMLWRTMTHLAIGHKLGMSSGLIREMEFKDMVRKAQSSKAFNRSTKTLMKEFLAGLSTHLDDAIHSPAILADQTLLDRHVQFLKEILE